MAPPHFLPLNTKIGRPVKYAKDKEAMCLTKDQTRHINRKVESESVVNIHRIKQEIEDDKLSRDKTDDEINPYQNIVVNNIDKENKNTSQMEHRSLLSNVVNYVQYDRNPKIFHELNIKTLDEKKNHKKMYDRLKDDERQTLYIHFGDNSDILMREYLDMYKRSSIASVKHY